MTAGAAAPSAAAATATTRPITAHIKEIDANR